MQRVAACCSVLQSVMAEAEGSDLMHLVCEFERYQVCVPVCCGVLHAACCKQRVACSVLQSVMAEAEASGVMQLVSALQKYQVCVAACCSVLHAACCRVLWWR